MLNKVCRNILALLFFFFKVVKTKLLELRVLQLRFDMISYNLDKTVQFGKPEDKNVKSVRTRVSVSCFC